MAEVARYQFGPTRVIVMDDAYAGKTPEEIKEVIRRASIVAAQYMRIPEMAVEKNQGEQETNAVAGG